VRPVASAHASKRLHCRKRSIGDRVDSVGDKVE
jgi:hypothetical protein